MSGNEITAEYEVRGGAWEVFFTLTFWIGIALLLTGTFGVRPAVFAPIGIGLGLFSLFAIASSPTYLLASGCALVLERTRFYLGFSRPVPLSGITGVLMTESRRSRDWRGGNPPDKDVTYWARVDIVTDHGRVRAFRSPLNGTPGDNRKRALEIAGRLSEMTGKPIENAER
jgi:hypothetical protein